MMRAPDTARLALGLALAVRPDLPLRIAHSRPYGLQDPVDAARTRETIRILGLRYLTQALGGSLVRRRWVPAVDASVDLVHAASMIVFAHFVPAHRRLANTSAVAALLFAAGDLASVPAPKARPKLRQGTQATATAITRARWI
jgi:hypothetical protein